MKSYLCFLKRFTFLVLTVYLSFTTLQCCPLNYASIYLNQKQIHPCNLLVQNTSVLATTVLVSDDQNNCMFCFGSFHPCAEENNKGREFTVVCLFVGLYVCLWAYLYQNWCWNRSQYNLKASIDLRVKRKKRNG